MELAIGTGLGPYEITERLGEGGMGEVYKAHDTRLGRSVAIKILRQSLGTDELLKKRFLREARAISAINHPNICGLYDIGNADGQDFLVMEFLEGETLAERLSRGLLPDEEAIRYGIEIASALDRAHRAGIIHRDLKPGNIMLTRSGAKLLDFGLARMTETSSSVAPLSADNALIGTVEYMAPEQLNGEAVDARADIFALGVVLYEMLTGARPFAGHNRASVIGAILFATPEPPSVKRTGLSPALDRILATCLQKDRDERIQTAHDLRLQLEWIRDGASGDLPSTRRARKWRTVSVMWAIPALLAGIASGVWLIPRAIPEQQRHEIRFHVVSPVAGEQIDWPAISPDGRKLAFVSANAAGERSLWLRDLSSTDARRLPETEGAIQPFWAPDSDAIGFFTGDKLQTLSLSAARPQSLAKADSPRGASWSASGTILFTPHITAPIHATTRAGSSSRAITKLDESQRDVTHRWPEFLPDGEHFIFVIRSRNLQRSGQYVGSTKNSEIRKVSTLQSRAIVTPSGWMLFVEDRKLVRQKFDLREFALSGVPEVIAKDIEPDLRITGATRISASTHGTISVSSPRDLRATIAWVDRQGRPIRTVAPAAHYVNIALSPDDRTIAVSRIDEESGRNSIWLVDSASGAMSPFVDDDSNADSPVWNEDGTRMLYTSDRRGTYEVYERKVGNVAADRLVFPSEGYALPVAVVSTGSLFHTVEPPDAAELWFWPKTAKTPTKITGQYTGASDLTPDGRWLALLGVREENASFNIFVRSLEDTSRTAQISALGGGQPTWRRDARELYYVRLDGQVIGIEFDEGRLGKQTPLFHLGAEAQNYSTRDFSPSADGTRFVVLQRSEAKQQTAATVILQR